MDGDERARRSAAAMWAADKACAEVGLTVDEVTEGAATLSMKIDQRHVNGHDICHGGFMFLLADSAFAYACNSYNRRAVAHIASVTFLEPVMAGDTLTATGRMIQRRGRSGICDVTVTNAAGAPVAEFRGHSREIGGTHFEE